MWRTLIFKELRQLRVAFYFAAGLFLFAFGLEYTLHPPEPSVPAITPMVFLLYLPLLIGAGAWTEERDSGAFTMLQVVPRGLWRTYVAKLVAGTVFTLLTVALLCIGDSMFYPDSDWKERYQLAAEVGFIAFLLGLEVSWFLKQSLPALLLGAAVVNVVLGGYWCFFSGNFRLDEMSISFCFSYGFLLLVTLLVQHIFLKTSTAIWKQAIQGAGLSLIPFLIAFSANYLWEIQVVWFHARSFSNYLDYKFRCYPELVQMSRSGKALYYETEVSYGNAYLFLPEQKKISRIDLRNLLGFGRISLSLRPMGEGLVLETQEIFKIRLKSSPSRQIYQIAPYLPRWSRENEPYQTDLYFWNLDTRERELLMRGFEIPVYWDGPTIMDGSLLLCGARELWKVDLKTRAMQEVFHFSTPEERNVFHYSESENQFITIKREWRGNREDFTFTEFQLNPPHVVSQRLFSTEETLFPMITLWWKDGKKNILFRSSNKELIFDYISGRFSKTITHAGGWADFSGGHLMVKTFNPASRFQDDSIPPNLPFWIST